MRLDQKVILVVHGTFFELSLWLWSGYPDPAIGEERPLAGYELFLSAAFVAVGLGGYTLNLLLGLNGLSRPKYGGRLTRSELAIYASGAAPAILAATLLLTWLCFSFGKAVI